MRNAFILVKRATIFITIITTVTVKYCTGHGIYKKIFTGSNKVTRIYALVPNQTISINSSYFPVINFTKGVKNKTGCETSKYLIRENLDIRITPTEEHGIKKNEGSYTKISASNFSQNKFDKTQPMNRMNNIFVQTKLKVPLFFPHLLDKGKEAGIDGYVSFKNFSTNENEMSEVVASSFKNINRYKFNNSFGINDQVHIESDSLRKMAKFLGLFTVVQFTNEICSAGSIYIYGTCKHYFECDRLEGIAKGTCAQGHGICCYVERTCGQRTNANAVYFSGGPFLNTSEHGIYGCSLTIDKADSSVTQIRLDFIDFQTAGPLNGNCQIDRFIISGQNYNNILPEICGSNSGEHIYIDIDSVPGPLMIAVLSSGANGLPTKFKIQIQQLRKGSEILAPSNCLQYFFSTNGIIKSFNYQSNITSDVVPGYMNNLNYAICIKKQPGYCGITYSNYGLGGMEMIFELNNIDDDGMPTVPDGEAGAESYSCPDDYIVLNNMRLCGHRLNDASENSNLKENHVIKVTDSGPFIIQFKTDANITGRGFHLMYQLNPCIVN